MSTVCYCGQSDCPVTTWEHDACIANLRAERDALRAQVAEAAERLDEFSQCPTLADGIQAMRLRMLTLRAQVEAARKACASLMRSTSVEWEDAGRVVLRAMDEAAK